MATYAVFEPPLKDQSAGVADVLTHAERFKFVRDGFSWLAFLFTPFWMLFNRLWLAFIVYVVLMVAITFGVVAAGLADGAVTLAWFVIALLAGFEAATLQRRKLLRKRWQDLGVVVADGREEAERRFFTRWVAQAPVVTTVAEAPRASTYDPASYVIGQFPSQATPPGKNP